MMPKFRAWHKPTQLMDDVVLIDFYNEKIGILYADPVMQCESIQKYNFDEVELMQSTGLHDKNGVEIFEGDILITKEKFADFTNYKFFEKEVVNTVIYDNSKAMFTLYQEGWGTVDENMSELEVIGNIFEDGDLIDG